MARLEGDPARVETLSGYGFSVQRATFSHDSFAEGDTESRFTVSVPGGTVLSVTAALTDSVNFEAQSHRFWHVAEDGRLLSTRLDFEYHHSWLGSFRTCELVSSLLEADSTVRDLECSAVGVTEAIERIDFAGADRPMELGWIRAAGVLTSALLLSRWASGSRATLAIGILDAQHANPLCISRSHNDSTTARHHARRVCSCPPESLFMGIRRSPRTAWRSPSSPQCQRRLSTERLKISSYRNREGRTTLDGCVCPLRTTRRRSAWCHLRTWRAATRICRTPRKGPGPVPVFRSIRYSRWARGYRVFAWPLGRRRIPAGQEGR